LKTGKEKKDRVARIHQSESRSLSKDPQVAMAQRSSYFHTVPEEEVWFVTINLEAVAPEAVSEKIKQWRSCLRRKFDNLADLLDVVVALGRFEDDPFIAEDMVPEELCKNGALADSHPRDVLMKLHIHLLVHVPHVDHDRMRDAFVQEFGPGKIVNIQNLRHKTDNQGIDLEGIDGAARYIAKEHVRLGGLRGATLRELDAVLKSLLLRKRTSTRFEYGLRAVANPEARRIGKWMKRCRREYDLPQEWDYQDVVGYLIDEDLSEVVHGYPSSLDAWEDMAEDAHRIAQLNGVTPYMKLASSRNLWNPGSDGRSKAFAWSRFPSTSSLPAKQNTARVTPRRSTVPLDAPRGPR
jgi:hypothetical protein